MLKETKEVLKEHGKRRREFVRRSAKLATAAPAVALLLSQNSASPSQTAISGISVTATTIETVNGD